MKQTSRGKIRYFSMFSGVGGFELGIDKALANSECIGYSEIDKYAIETYERHYGHTNYGDATKLDERQLPDFELLVGGFPCQAFSVAGKRAGFDDTRGTLFFDIARVLKHKRPRHLVLENVKGLLSHDSGKTFQTILGVLTDLGYGVEWQILNGKRWVPQNRERIVIVGHLRGECGRTILPFREEGQDDTQGHRQQESGSEIAWTLDANYYKGVSPKGYQGSKRQLIADTPSDLPQGLSNKGTTLKYVGAIMSEQNKAWLEDGKHKSRNFPQGQRVYAADGISATIASQAGGLGAKTGLYAIPVLTPDRPVKRQNGRRMKDDGDPQFTLNTQDKHGIYDGARIRRLTPKECERLMGWPDDWTAGISDTQRYKQCGNGIIAPMVSAIMERLKPCLA